jgi:hypothetical protein
LATQLPPRLLTIASFRAARPPLIQPLKLLFLDLYERRPKMSQRIAHMVYFTLEDDSQDKVELLLSECKKYLNDHPGLEYFAVGSLNRELSRPVNDRDFHVSLNTVFSDRAAHDAYQVNPRHVEFIENNKSNWKQVRVFDSNLE